MALRSIFWKGRGPGANSVFPDAGLGVAQSLGTAKNDEPSRSSIAELMVNQLATTTASDRGFNLASHVNAFGACVLFAAVCASRYCGDFATAGMGVQPSDARTGAAVGLAAGAEVAEVGTTEDGEAPLVDFSGAAGFPFVGGTGSVTGATTGTEAEHAWHSIGHVRQVVA
jgi:hypothetical protein